MNESTTPQSPAANPQGNPWRSPEQAASDQASREQRTKAAAALAPPAASGLLKNVAEGAHHGIDRLADQAAPALQRMDKGVAAVEEALHAKAGQLRAAREAWVEGARSTVQHHPLTSVAAALAAGLALGMVISGTRR